MRDFLEHEAFPLQRDEVQSKLLSGAYISVSAPPLRIVVLPSFEARFSWEIRSRLERVSVPLASQHRAVVIDGITYALHLIESTRTLQLEWNEAERCTAPLSAVIDELLERFEAQRPASSNAMHFK